MGGSNHNLSTESTLTLTWSEIEPWQRDNPSILTGYRKATNSWTGCFKTTWLLHNESVNIWSHLLSALGTVVAFLVAIWGIGVKHHTFYEDSQLLKRAGIMAPFKVFYPFPTFTHPSVTSVDTLLTGVFLASASICFIFSFVFHTSLCHSKNVAAFMNRIDYFGILILGTTNFFPTFHYSFFCHPILRDIYITLMTISGSIGIYMACSATYATPAYRRMRTYTFFACGWVAVLPFAHAIWKNGWAESRASMAFEWIGAEVVLYMFGAFLYSERFPERLAPGKFDYFGSSHQIFHICSVLAVVSHWAAVGEGFRYWHGENQGVC